MSRLFPCLLNWKACQIVSVKNVYQQVHWHPAWCMFVLGSLRLLCLVDLHLFFYPSEQQIPIVPLHFIILLQVLMCVCTILLSVVSRNSCLLSSTCTWLLGHVFVSILCLLLLCALILCGLQSLDCLFVYKHLGSALFSRILDWYTLAGML